MSDSALAAALAKFHTNLPEVHKGSTNPAFKSKYADLADVVKVVLPALAAQGLAWITRPVLTEDGFVLAYELRHVSGESITGEWPLPDPTKAKPQELGSAVTYAKRYTLSAVTGIAPDEDDDGNAASADSAARAARREPRPPARERVAKAVAAIAGSDSREALIKVWDAITVSGLNGVPEIVAAHAEQSAKFPADTADAWALEPPVEAQR